MEMNEILFSKNESGIAEITFNRPQAFNALTWIVLALPFPSCRSILATYIDILCQYALQDDHYALNYRLPDPAYHLQVLNPDVYLYSSMIAAANPDHILRLEVEDYNARAKHTYEKNGFEVIPYCEMIRLKGR